MSNKKPIPKWLAKTGKPVFWTFRHINGQKIVSRGTVLRHRNGEVYIVGKAYGYWACPQSIKQVRGCKEGEFID